MALDNNILIIGIDSLIGRHLSEIYKKNGWNVFGTTRNKNNENIHKNILFFQLGNNIKDLYLDNYQVCILCAGTSSIEQCEKDPIKTREINVSYIMEIFRECNKLNLFTIFLSSDLVFSGEKIFPDVNDEPRPNTNHGFYKLEVEKYINSLKSNNFSILRLTKVISDQTPLLKKWSGILDKNLNIEAFDNVYISPIDINVVLKTIYEISNNKFSGLYQLGGNMILSYYEFSKIYFSERGFNTKLILPLKANLDIIYNPCSSLKICLPSKIMHELN